MACINLQRLSKNTLLSILPSYYDPTFVIDKNTGDKIRIDSLNNGPLSKIQVVNGGFGYSTSPEVIISGGGGSGATASAVIYNEQINRIDITNSGQGYTKPPEIIISGGDGTGAYAVSYLKDLTNIFKNGVYKKRYLRIETLYPRNLLTAYNNWEIKAFNPRTREVCIVFNKTLKNKTCKSCTNFMTINYGEYITTENNENIILPRNLSSCCYYNYIKTPNATLSYTIPENF